MNDGFKKQVEKSDADALADWTSRKQIYDASEKKKREEHEEVEKEKQAVALAAGEPYIPTYYSAYGSGFGYGWDAGPGAAPTPEGDWGVQRKLEAVLKKHMAIYGAW